MLLAVNFQHKLSISSVIHLCIFRWMEFRCHLCRKLGDLIAQSCGDEQRSLIAGRDRHLDHQKAHREEYCPPPQPLDPALMPGIKFIFLLIIDMCVCWVGGRRVS